MEPPVNRPFFPVLMTSIFLAVLGWGGLFIVVFLTEPFLGPRWLFFFFLTIALSGMALPVATFFNIRFPSDPPVENSAVLRQALGFGIFGSLLAWLQIGRVLSLILFIFLAGGFILIEMVIRMFERSRWKPKGNGDE